MLIIWQFIHEGEEETDPIRIPDVKKNVLILFRLEKWNGMDFELPERAAVKRIQQTMQMAAQFVIESGEELRDLLLRHRRREIDIPDRQAGKRLHIPGEQAMQKCGATSQIPYDEQRLIDRLCFMTRKKQIIQKETEPVEESSQRPNGVIE